MKRFLVLMSLLIVLNLALPGCTPAAPTNPTAAVSEPTASAAPTNTIQPTDTAAPADTATAAPQTTPTSSAITLKDGLGREVSLPAPAQHIVSLAPSNSEILFAIGAGAQVVARDDFTNYPQEAVALPSIGGSASGYNNEKIVSLQPDLVIASELNNADQVKSLENLKITVFYLQNPKNMEGLFENLRTVGKLTGHEKEASTLADSLSARVSAVEKAVEGVSSQPKVFYELDATDPAKPWTPGPGTFIDTLIQMAGGKNVGASLNGEWAKISQEALIVDNPDFILLGDSLYGGVTAEKVAARPGWNTLKAVQNKNVLPFNDDLVSRPGPRMVDGLVALAKILHPDRTADLQ
jgi:iron complex transport system substrate-binding protein